MKSSEIIEKLIRKAKAVAKAKELSNGNVAGSVGSALMTDKGNIYVGVSLDLCCGIGFCAEHSAIAAMVTAREYRVKYIVAVTEDGHILPPCGRCRELLKQIDEWNYENTLVILSPSNVVPLKMLLPHPWEEGLKQQPLSLD
ncbi:MAG: cytidine deaminase [Thermoprotei archaeon]|nr:MAG: cytidine deaminase [Thermoprotei archaeon]